MLTTRYGYIIPILLFLKSKVVHKTFFVKKVSDVGIFG